ncbi:MAG: lysophospholipid acyltransferase family protein [Verrucomicrobiaceae bacterium]|nr:lysophospholipid acyltransferase family protein [Verrucomicrobiaceae bacterium]
MEDDRRKYQPLIDLEGIPNRLLKTVLPVLGPSLSEVLGIRAVNDIHAKLVAAGTPETMWSTLVEATGVNYEVAASDLDRIPPTGPVVVVSNHPLGGLDGIVLGDILHRRRRDSRLMANFLLKRVLYSEHHMFFVDPFPRGEEAKRASLAGMKASLKHLKAGGLLGVFPGNRVSHYQKDLHTVADGPWIESIGALVRHTEATVVPVFIEGGNSTFFNLAGMVHPLLRTILLARELVRRARDPEPVRVHVGTPIPFTRLKRFETDKELVNFLRMATYVMGNRPDVTPPDAEQTVAPVTEPEPVADKLSPELLQADVDALPPECKLLANGDYEVYIARSSQMPSIMHEIGRGREAAFRYAGGGTLKPLDLAPQDDYYHHLFLWHTKDQAVVGAYRLGLSDEIIAKHGPEGLICSGLFDLKPEFLRQLNPGIELGRSYVLPEYMRNYNSLLLLWAGILQFVVREPKYKMCFGSVGISQGDEYTPASRTLIVDYMKEHLSHPTLSLQVESRSPFYGVKLNGVKPGEANRMLQSVDDVSVLVTGLEPDGKGVPILIKHYARMNAKLLSFGVWTNHSNAVVSFMVADLTTADPKFLKRYMGEEGYKTFMAHHGHKVSDD